MTGRQPDRPAYLDPARATADRVEDLLARMTLTEKLGQMMQLDAQGDPEEIVLDKLAGSVLHASPARLHALHALVVRTRLRIPLLVAEDCIHGHSFWPGATIFPVQLGLASTFDPELVRRVARVTAREVAATGVHWVLSPVLCVARELRWGRVNETFGEDPHLISVLGAAMIRGYQQPDFTDDSTVLACAKHFAGYSETQGGRDASEADLSRRKLAAWFLPPFEHAVGAGCRTVMLGYQAIEGVPVTANRWLLDDVLRAGWNFAGVLVTDWDNVGRMVWEQQVCHSLPEAAASAIRAGNDLTMCTPDFAVAATEAIRDGLVPVGLVDRAVRRVLTVKVELGLFENPRLPSLERERAIGIAEHAQLNLDAARRSVVLLRNNGRLPLNTDAAHFRLAVLGPNADDAQGQLGDWAGSSGQIGWLPDGQPRALIETVLDGMRGLAPDSWDVRFASGADIVTGLPPSEQVSGPWVAATPDPAAIGAAADLARWADHAMVVVGDHIALTGEARSTATLELIGGQVALLDAVVATGTPTTVVVISGKPLVLPPSALAADALIQAFSPGMRGGRAIAELVLGAIEPSGRLPISIPRHAGQLPVYYNTVRGQHGDRYADLTQAPQFAFGEGLSYSQVRYGPLRVTAPRVRPGDRVRASVEVANVGRRPVVETVQAYVRDVVASVTWAERELKSFVQVQLDPGESRTVPIEFPASACSIVDAAGERRVEPGAFQLMVGPSSRPADLIVAEFEITDG